MWTELKTSRSLVSPSFLPLPTDVFEIDIHTSGFPSAKESSSHPLAPEFSKGQPHNRSSQSTVPGELWGTRCNLCANVYDRVRSTFVDTNRIRHAPRAESTTFEIHWDPITLCLWTYVQWLFWSWKYFTRSSDSLWSSRGERFG